MIGVGRGDGRTGGVSTPPAQPTTVTPPSLRAELKLALQFAPIPFDDMSDRVGGELSDMPAEQIRRALRLLLPVGVFSGAGMDGLILSADVASVEDGVTLAGGRACDANGTVNHKHHSPFQTHRIGSRV